MTSRFTVVDAPTLAPGTDYVTGTAVGPFIDTGRDIRDQAGRNLGRLYLSKSTIAEMARELGLIGGHADSTAIEAAYNKGKLDGIQEELGGDLYSVTDTLRRWLAHVDSTGSAVGNGQAQG